MAALQRAPVRQTEIVYATPLIADILFSEMVDTTRNAVPAYGTAHPNTVKFPHHSLVYVREASQGDSGRDKMFEFFYAAEQENQDLYNFSFVKADIGGTKFDSVVRSYVTLRSEFDPDEYTMGDAMPNIPSGLFTGDYVLAERNEKRIGDQVLDGLFVAEDLTYVKRVSIVNTNYGQSTGRPTQTTSTLFYLGEEVVGGLTIEQLSSDPTDNYLGLQSDGTFREVQQLSENWWQIIESSVLPASPVNTTANPAKTRVSRRFTPLGTDVLFTEIGAMPTTVPSYGSAHYSFANHKLVYIEPADESGLLHKFTYVAEQENQDLYNFSFVKADIGGTKFDSVVRSYVTLRSEFDPDEYTMGDAMPNIPSGLFTGDYVLAERNEKRIGDQVLDGLFVAEDLTYVKRCTITDVGIDDLSGKSLITKTKLYYASETVPTSLVASALFEDPTNVYWGLQNNGEIRIGKQLSCEWYLIEERQVIAGTLTGNVLNIGTYFTNDNYYWPPVLNIFEILSWVRNDGGADKFPSLRFSPEGYNGPCLTQITRTWQKTPFTSASNPPLVVVSILQPTRIYYSCPFYTVNIPECLHPTVGFQADTGNNDPVYTQNVNSSRFFSATNPESGNTWPASIVAYDEQEPYRGGFLRTRRVVSRPPIPATVNFLTGNPIAPP